MNAAAMELSHLNLSDMCAAVAVVLVRVPPQVQAVIAKDIALNSDSLKKI